MKKLFIAFAACAMFVACGNKAAETETTEEEVAVEEVAEEAVEAEAAEVAEESELPTLIDLYVKACDEANEVEATRVAKRIHNEYEAQLTSADIERMANASAALAAKRAEQAQEVAAETKEAVGAATEALKGLKK